MPFRIALPPFRIALLLLAAHRVAGLTCWAGSATTDDYQVSQCVIAENSYTIADDDEGNSVDLQGNPQSGLECSGTCSITSGGAVDPKTGEQVAVSFVFQCYEAGETCVNIREYTMAVGNLSVTTSQRCCATDDCNGPPKKFVSACETGVYDDPLSFNDDDLFKGGGGGGGGGGSGGDDDDDDSACPLLTCIVPIACGGGLMLIGFSIGTFFYLKKKKEANDRNVAATADESGDSNTLYNPLSGGGEGNEA